MSNSGLVSYTRISPNRNSPRNHKIDTITIHCAVANCSVERFGEIFAPTTKKASCNYAIGADGRIGMYVEEKDRSWCSSNAENDNRAITIECASDNFHPYAINDVVYDSLIRLCADICLRNGIKELKWKADKSLIGQPDKQNMTVHRWFANKSCPGDYIYSRLGKIAEEVNSRIALGNDTSFYTRIEGTAVATADQMKAYIRMKNPNVASSVIDMIPLYLSEGTSEGIRGDVAFAQSCIETGNFAFGGSAVTLDQNNFCGLGVTSTGMTGNSFDTPQIGIRAQIQHLKAYANNKPLSNSCVDPRFNYVTRGSAEFVEWLGIKENPNGVGWASGEKYGEKILSILQNVIKMDTTEDECDIPFPITPFKVNVIIDDLNYRSAPSMNGAVKGQTGKGTFTIVEVSNGWGKLKSGAGWIWLVNSSYCTIPDAPPFKVKVSISDLNIRKGAGTNYAIVSQIKPGVYTITDVANGPGSKYGWGKLKSGAGWISLDYATKI